ncbi:hypothetical protein T265_12549, partial [Opisthorchis viverrini]
IKERLVLDSGQRIHASNLHQFSRQYDQPINQRGKSESWETSEDLVGKCRKLITYCYRHEKMNTNTTRYEPTSRVRSSTDSLVCFQTFSLIVCMHIKRGARNEHIRSEYTSTGALLKHLMCGTLDAFPCSEIQCT